MPFDEPPPSWHLRLAQAHSRQDVVRVAREFVARLAPDELAGLPQECRPGRIGAAEDIGTCALALVQHSCRGDRLADAGLQHLAAFFTRASVRLAQLTAHARETPTEHL